jgi:hypothetical protein
MKMNKKLIMSFVLIGAVMSPRTGLAQGSEGYGSGGSTRDFSSEGNHAADSNGNSIRAGRETDRFHGALPGDTTSSWSPGDLAAKKNYGGTAPENNNGTDGYNSNSAASRNFSGLTGSTESNPNAETGNKKKLRSGADS